MKTVLFVCTGNTCRSPMAACLFNALCRKQGIVDIRAESAGIYAHEGDCASTEAVKAMKRRGLDLTGHRAQRISKSHLRKADVVIGMSLSHVQALGAVFDTFTPVLSFSPPIVDPYGGNAFHYEETACELEAQMPEILVKIFSQQFSSKK